MNGYGPASSAADLGGLSGVGAKDWGEGRHFRLGQITPLWRR